MNFVINDTKYYLDQRIAKNDKFLPMILVEREEEGTGK